VLGRRQRRDPPGAEVKCHRTARHQVQRHDPGLQEEQDLLERCVASTRLATRARDDCACGQCGWAWDRYANVEEPAFIIRIYM